MNYKMKKAVASICMGAAVLTLTPAVSMAETATIFENDQQENSIAPYMLYIRDSSASLAISGTKATVDCSVSGNRTSATKAKVVAELQVKNGSSWTTVKTWTDTQNDYEAYVYETYTITKGNTYRVKASVTVWEDSLSETQTVYSGEKTA